ncbi:MAG TPA: DUF3857 domain-containing protein, partial [Sphingomicrobium sp.]|nr:DUF3857 domain-containing protein [Sphingomicrobium sp.]
MLAPGSARAADALKFGSPPSWVIPKTIPEVKPSDAPIAVLLSDQQVRFDPGKSVTHSRTAIKIQNSQGLQAGNISLAWRPETDTVTVNKLHIHRGGHVIDVLGKGQTFTVARRETNLDAAMLDGSLTANIQPEGLQEGDIIDLATTTEHADPVMGSHVEAFFGAWNGTPVESAHVALSWPTALKINLRQSPGLPTPRRSERDGRMVAEFSSTKVQPLLAPKGAPLRFKVGRIGEATDFDSWSDVSDLFAPLYRTAATIPAAGPLRDEVEGIRRSAKDPQARVEQALALVQNRVRYVALLMGQAGYVPASAESTWSRRYGDCKGKTALLLGLLHEFGVEAEPVLVSVVGGDAIADRLPMVSLFNHVLVRARLGGKTYWLDGTRTGDASLPAIKVPDFGWGLPLVAGAQLTRIVPPPLHRPQLETFANIDASAGIKAPAAAKFEQVIRGDHGTALNMQLAALTAQQRDEFLSSFWKGSYDFLTVKSTSARFDKASGELRLTATGDAQLDWAGGYYHLVNSSVGFAPDFERTAGPQQDAPMAVDYPLYHRTVTTVRLPTDFFKAARPTMPQLREQLAGVEYRRSARTDGDSLTVETSTRSLVPEVSYKDALAAAPRLRALADEDISLRLPAKWQPTAGDIKAMLEQKPASASAFLDRGLVQLNGGEY